MVWQARLTVDQPLYYKFLTLLQHIEENGTGEENLKKIKCDIQLNLCQRVLNSNSLKNRNKYWVKDLFTFERPEAVVRLSFTRDQENKLLHLTSDASLRIRHRSSSLSSFWISVSKEYTHFDLFYNYISV